MAQWVNRLRNNIYVNPPPLPLLCEISGAPGLMAGRQAGRQAGKQAGRQAGRLAGWLAGRPSVCPAGRRNTGEF